MTLITIFSRSGCVDRKAVPPESVSKWRLLFRPQTHCLFVPVSARLLGPELRVLHRLEHRLAAAGTLSLAGRHVPERRPLRSAESGQLCLLLSARLHRLHVSVRGRVSQESVPERWHVRYDVPFGALLRVSLQPTLRRAQLRVPGDDADDAAQLRRHGRPLLLVGQPPGLL